MSNQITVSRLKFELNKVLEKLNQFDDGENVSCWHVWADDMQYEQTDSMNFINAIQVYRGKNNQIQLDINCFD
jgi:hypothetical protein